MHLIWRICLICLITIPTGVPSAQDIPRRPMTIDDVLHMRKNAGGSLSPDGSQYIYSIQIPDIAKGEYFADLYLRETASGAELQMTYTPDKNELAPAWHPDGSYFAFLSNRYGNNQVYCMHAGGGEAWAVTSAKDGVNAFAFSRDGKFLAFSAGAAGQQELFVYDLLLNTTRQLTAHSNNLNAWIWDPGGTRLYYTAQEQPDHFIRQREKNEFDVRIRDEARNPAGLWSVTVADSLVRQLWSDSTMSVQSCVIAEDSRWVAFTALKAGRHASPFTDTDIFLYETRTGHSRRITANAIGESGPVFSPDSRMLAFGMCDPPVYGQTERLFVTPVDGGEPRCLTRNFDYDVIPCFWSRDSRAVHADIQQGVRRHAYRFNADSGQPEQVTALDGSVQCGWDRLSGGVIISFSDPYHPTEQYWTNLTDLSYRDRWTPLTNTNPQFRDLQLGEVLPYHWKSTDDSTVEGILYLPFPRPAGSMPLIVQLHGGPASAKILDFSSSYGYYSHVFTGKGYAVLQPNFRGSTGYGGKFRMQIAGDYFRQAYDDIMRGVDALIRDGIAHPDSLGVMGWSAGGHWSNWILVSTDRFKAISTGAGAVNWISLYAQTDVQVTREFYFGGRPYDNWDHYVNMSPLKYIQNAVTPTLIHFGDLDPRIPRPQGDELYMALKQRGVPVEYIVYPRQPHGLEKLRYQQVKMEAELGWFERWIRGREVWIDWQRLVDSVEVKK